MTDEEIDRFVVAQANDRCESCNKLIQPYERFICICKVPAGGTDTLCYGCYLAMVQSSIAWFKWNGQLPVESEGKRLQRARRTAQAARMTNRATEPPCPN